MSGTQDAEGGLARRLADNPGAVGAGIVAVCAVLGVVGGTLALYPAAALVLVGTWLATKRPNRLGKAIALGLVVGGIVMAVVIVVFHSTVFA